jgi:hypothetical protein
MGLGHWCETSTKRLMSELRALAGGLPDDFELQPRDGVDLSEWIGKIPGARLPLLEARKLASYVNFVKLTMPRARAQAPMERRTRAGSFTSAFRCPPGTRTRRPW